MMAVYTDILVADSSEAHSILASQSHDAQWPCTQAKGVGPGELAALLSLLTGEPANVDGFTVVAEEDAENGPWLYQLPDRLVERLALLEVGQVDQVAGRWASEMGVPPYLLERANAPAGTGLLAKFFGRARTSAAVAELERYRAQSVESNQWMLKELGPLARTARAEGKQLLLWVCV
jgi:hypothetical protein